MNYLLIVWYCSDCAARLMRRRHLCRNTIVFGLVSKRNSFRFLPWRTSVSAKSPWYAKTSLWFVFRGANKVKGAHTLVICLFATRLVFVQPCALLKSNLAKFSRLKSEKNISPSERDESSSPRVLLSSTYCMGINAKVQPEINIWRTNDSPWQSTCFTM